MKSDKPNGKHRLLIQHGGLFNCPYEWTITDFVYWKSNTQDDRRWTCRMRVIQHFTPVKRIETITDALDRLCERGMGFSKIPYGEPQLRRCGDGLTAEPVQSYQYVFDAKVFDAWLKSQPPKPPIRKRIDPYPKADSQLSENGQQTYPKADTTIRNKKEEKKEIKEIVGSQPPSVTAAAPEPERNLAEEFDRLFEGTSLASVPSSGASQPAEGGVPVGVPSTSVASPAHSIQSAYGNPNGAGNDKPNDGLACSGAAVVQPSPNQSYP